MAVYSNFCWHMFRSFRIFISILEIIIFVTYSNNDCERNKATYSIRF